MSLAMAIAPHIPYLRRYARALSGTQESGDAYVAGALEALIEGEIQLDDTVAPRVALYRAFSSTWQSMANATADPDQSDYWEKVANKQLLKLPPMSRQAFLLQSVEGFDSRSAAFILDVDEVTFSQLIDQATSEIARQIATRILIIEDEPLIAMELESIVLGLGHSVDGVARTHDEATKMAEKYQPGLVLADIQLADGSSGVDAVNDILKSLNAPVIFITAYPERLLTGERPEPAFLITKPFFANTVKATVSQALFFENNCGSADQNAAA